MKLFCSTKKLIDKTKNGENVSSFEVVEVVLVRCGLVDNQNQQKSEVLCTFTRNKSFAYLLNVEPSSLMFIKTYNSAFDEIVIIFEVQNSRQLEIKGKVNLALLVHKWK